jgi:hypothetical protein
LPAFRIGVLPLLRLDPVESAVQMASSEPADGQTGGRRESNGGDGISIRSFGR